MVRVAALLATAIAYCSAAAVHPERLIQIEKIKNATSLWTPAAQSRFASQPVGSSARLCGVKGDWHAMLKTRLASGDVVEFQPKDPTMAIPDSFDSATYFSNCSKIIDDIRDQSNCGCCWAFAGAEAASDRMCIATGGKMMVPISAQDVCFCASPSGCNGGMIDTPWEHIANEGAVSGGQYKGSGPFGSQCADFTLPHCHHHGPIGKDPYPPENSPGCPHQQSAMCPKKCGASFPGTFDSDKYTFKGKTMIANGETKIQQMIMEGGPVETAFTVYSDFEDYAGGIYTHVTGQAAGGHAVKFVGWGVDKGTKYWKVANSWNPYWGENGYFRIVRGEGQSKNNGGIENMVTGSPTDATWSKGSPDSL